MWWVDDIFSLVWDISGFFRDAYLEVQGWIWPFYLLYWPLYLIYKAVWSLLTPIAHFSDWTRDVWNKVLEIFSIEQITAHFVTWINYAINAWDWVANAFLNVWLIINAWWSEIMYIILAWIDDAKLWFQALLNQANAWLASLQSYWDSIVGKIPSWDEVATWWKDWLGNVFAALIRWGFATLLDVGSLIASAFLEREDFWAGWQDLRGNVTDFFTDPLEFLWTLFTDWFLGPEE